MGYTFGETNSWVREIMKPYISRNKIIEKEKRIVHEGGKFRLYNFKATSNISFLINIYKFV